MQIEPLSPALGVRIAGVDLGGDLLPAAVDTIAAALRCHGVVVIPGQAIDDGAQVRFARHFGTPGVFGDEGVGAPEIFRIANTDLDGSLLPADSPRSRLNLLNWSWHADNSYSASPTHGSVLRAIAVVREGGATVFANMVAAYDALPVTMKARLAGLSARHSFAFLVKSHGLPPLDGAEMARLAPVVHPLVRQLPDGRRSLYLSPPYMETIVGLPQEDSLSLLRELAEWATQERFTYSHQWQPGDVLMWDNDWTMHKVTPYDHARRPRVLHGVTWLGVEPVRPA